METTQKNGERETTTLLCKCSKRNTSRSKVAGFRSAIGILNCELKIRNSIPFAFKNVSKGSRGHYRSPNPSAQSGKNLFKFSQFFAAGIYSMFRVHFRVSVYKFRQFLHTSFEIILRCQFLHKILQFLHINCQFLHMSLRQKAVTLHRQTN